MRFLVLVAACAGARRLDIAGDATQGACYNADGTYGVTCNVAEADCTGSVSYTHLTLPTKRIV